VDGNGSATDDVAFGELLRAYRRAAGLTQEALADAADIAVRTVRNVESGRVAPQQRTAELFADGLGLDDAARARLLGAARLLRRSRSGVLGEAEGTGPRLPPPVGFVGRAAELAQLLAEANDVLGLPANRTVVVSGQPGVGKTALVAQAGHQLRERFAGRVHFVRLAGTGDASLTADQVLEQLLGEFGAEGAQIPGSSGERLALYQMVTRERGGLLILDDAASEQQVRPLLPAGPSWLVLISSRRSLGGLTDVRRIALDLPPVEEAVTMLGRAESAAVVELAELCGRLPLALRVACALLDGGPRWTIEELVASLAGEQDRLDVLHAGDTQVRSAVAVSYRQLTGEQRILLRRLAMMPWREYVTGHAAALGGIAMERAEDVLEDLVDAGLLTASARPGHYGIHDLIRLFGAERADAEEAGAAREAALDRVRAWLIDSVVEAGCWIAPTPRERPSRVVRSLPDLPSAQRFPHGVAAVDWLTEQREPWLWAVERSAEHRCHRDVIEAETALHWYADRYEFGLPWERVGRLAVAAAIEEGDRRAEAERRNSLGWYLITCSGRVSEAMEQHLIALGIARDSAEADPALEALSNLLLGRTRRASGALAEAIADHERAVRLFESAGDPFGMGLALLGLGRVCRESGDPAAAVDVHLRCLRTWEAGSDDSFALLPGLGHVRLQLGHDHVALGRPDAAADWFAEAADWFTKGRDDSSAGSALLLLGTTLAEVDPARAEQALRRADTLLHDAFRPLPQASALHRLGTLATIGPAERERLGQRALALCAGLPTGEAHRLGEAIRADLAGSGPTAAKAQ
jgi:transcriptional regulator with XRE-family HTH domain/tetratricopeptide (TPR) repeat protein